VIARINGVSLQAIVRVIRAVNQSRRAVDRYRQSRNLECRASRSATLQEAHCYSANDSGVQIWWLKISDICSVHAPNSYSCPFGNRY
jgi:hypothetical protein